jgi:UDP-GlcNAc3NAcA epimerase
MKVVTVVGARPQFIKAAVVGAALRAAAPQARNITIHTGQHYDDNMSDVFFRQLGIPAPDHHLGIGGLSSGAMTGRMIEGIEGVLLREKPRAVLVYGDTDSTLAGALAAAKLHVPVAHVEAGLRSFDRRMPEEINRVLTDHVADVLYTTSAVADAHLRNEGVAAQAVRQVGDVMYDACLTFAGRAATAQVDLPDEPYVLGTLHRAATTDDPRLLARAVDAFNSLARGCAVVIPLHPRTRKRLEAAGLLAALASACRVIEPVGYLEMLKLLKHCAGVATDSGGLQKEAYYLGKRCIVLRDRTEWTELVDLGHARLLDPAGAAPLDGLLHAWLVSPLQAAAPLYGGGRASQAIAADLVRRYGEGNG